MNAAQMLAAAGEPNTTTGRAKFHQRFKNKQAFDVWYNSKKEYGGGLTDGIAFPQQPDASSRRVPYYDKGGFFAPNVMPWNGPMGFYEHGGLHKYQDAGQVPPFLGTDPNNYYTERDQAALQGQQNFGDQGFDYEGPITRPGYSFPPSVTPSPYTPYIPGLQLGEDSDRNPNVNIGVGDPRTRKKHPSGGGSSRHHQPIGKQISRWWDKNFQGKGGRKYDVARCWGGKCHEYGGMTDGIAFPQQPTDHINFSAFPWQPQYDMGGLPGGSNDMPCLECGGNMAYGGYMQTGGTTQMDQGQYTNGMAQQYMKSLADFSMAAQPMPMGNVQEAGYGAYGTEVNYNQMEDFNTLDMNAVDQMSSMQNRLDDLKNKQTSIFDLGRNLTNIGSSIYQKPMSYKTKTVGSGMMGPAASPAGTSNNWADTRSNMAAKQAAGNMFKEYGGDFFQNGGSENKMNYQNRVQDILMKGQARPTFGQSSAQSYKGNAAQAAANTQGSSGQQTQQQYTPDQIAAFQSMMQNYFNQNAYAPSYQAYDPKGQFPMSQFLNNSALTKLMWKGYGRKGKATFRTVYDPSTGKTVQVPTNQDGMSRNYDSTKTGKEAKGPGFIKNLIAKNKQRKADKNISKEQKLRMIADQEKMMMPTPDTYQGELAKSQQMPLTGEQRKKQFFDAKLAQDLNNPNYGNRTPTQSNAIPFNPGYQPAPQIGFEYGGFPQYNYGGYPQYAVGGEAEMTDDEIENYLAMGGTLEYLD